MLQDVVKIYLSSLLTREDERGGGSHNTSMAYGNDLNQFCRYLLEQGITDWSQVSREVVALYLLHMRDGNAYRPTTIARKIAALKSFFHYLYEQKIIAEDPVEKLDVPRIQKDLPQVLTSEQVSRLFDQVDVSTLAGIRDLAMLHVLYATGIRASELVSLNLDDFNPAYSSIICSGRDGRTWRTRVLPLSTTALETTLHYLEQARPYLVRASNKQSALFLNLHGDRLTRQGFWLIIKGYARQAGLATITPHMLRHSFAIAMLKGGTNLRSVQALLGHAHISTTHIYNQMVRMQNSREEDVARPQEE